MTWGRLWRGGRESGSAAVGITFFVLLYRQGRPLVAVPEPTDVRVGLSTATTSTSGMSAIWRGHQTFEEALRTATSERRGPCPLRPAPRTCRNRVLRAPRPGPTAAWPARNASAADPHKPP